LPDRAAAAPVPPTAAPVPPASAPVPPTAEHARLAESAVDRAGEWKALGPYVSERAWGTVREDYSADGDAWRYFPYEHGRSRAYRWSEDGLAGVCDRSQALCFALSLWNGRDPFLKERLFGLSGPEGNHGEDVKEYWWYADATPTASWLSWIYHYPQAEFPYARLRAESARRSRDNPEFELADTGVFDGDRYWRIAVDYAKAAPYDLCIRIRIRNEGREAATIDVLPTLWWRNRWTWEVGAARPAIAAQASPRPDEALATATDETSRSWRLAAGPDPAGRPPELLFCENETNVPLLFGGQATTPFPKDGINDHIVSGAPTVNPDRRGTKMAARYRLTIAPGDEVVLRLRLQRDDAGNEADLGDAFAATLATRLGEADAFYAALRPASATDEEGALMRQAYAGMIWSQQFYHFSVARWLDGDPTEPVPPRQRLAGRDSKWRHLNAHDIIAMPDKWEYPWFAAWDLAFHSVVLARLDPAAAKHQLLLLFREWYTDTRGQVPAYEWDFSDVNPPVHAWAALTVFGIDGGQDFDFLARIFQKLLINFTWWVNRKDALGDNVFEGGFLGLDNIGPFDRSAELPRGGLLEQSDSTAWMAKYCLNMLEMALRLANHDRAYEDIALKFFEHFAAIAGAMNELWDETDGFFYDRLRRPDGSTVVVRARSAVGLLPVFASCHIPSSLWQQLPNFRARARWFIDNMPAQACFVRYFARGGQSELLCLVDRRRLERILSRMLDETEFLSPFGLRSLSRWHRDHPLVISVGGVDQTLDYEPAESTTPLFGGNSNWRGPVWFPLNLLAVESLRGLYRGLGDEFTVELPTGSGKRVNLREAADEIERRLVSLFLPGPDGRRPADGPRPLFRPGSEWTRRPLFYEYFNGDTGEGLGASHQTGWTALVAPLIVRRARS